MKSKTSPITQKLLNLYRQHHVIYGGWAAINPIFIAEADENILTELKLLPTGSRLAQHIENLRSGKTPMNTISHRLLPYGGKMGVTIASVPLSESELTELKYGISNFTPDDNGLINIKSLSVVKKFGEEWLIALRSALTGDKELLEKWDVITKTARAHYLWKVANDLLSEPLSERSRAQAQAELSEYETYLPMFGDAGNDLLIKLRNFVTVR